MAFKTLERKSAKQLTMGKDGFDKLEGILLTARTNIGRNNSTLYTFKQENGETVKIWGNRSIDESLLDESGKRVVPDANGALVRITVNEMVPVGDNGAVVADCLVEVDSSVRAFKKPAPGSAKKGSK